MQPHLTPYHTGLLAKALSFLCILVYQGDCMSCLNLGRETMKPQRCCIMYGINVLCLLMGSVGVFSILSVTAVPFLSFLLDIQ